LVRFNFPAWGLFPPMGFYVITGYTMKQPPQHVCAFSSLLGGVSIPFSTPHGFLWLGRSFFPPSPYFFLLSFFFCGSPDSSAVQIPFLDSESDGLSLPFSPFPFFVFPTQLLFPFSLRRLYLLPFLPHCGLSSCLPRSHEDG